MTLFDPEHVTRLEKVARRLRAQEVSTWLQVGIVLAIIVVLALA